MSWVLLTESHAFKLKKPLQLPYVDYRTIDLRHQSCERELRLGRRLAPDVYDAVLPVVQRGEIVDWLLAMRRLPRESMLPEMLARGAARPAHARALGDLLADFYRRAQRTAWDGVEYRRRLSDLVTADGRELVARGAAVEPLVGDVLAAIEREASALDDRVVEGRIVDAHGDLRPEHVCFETRPLVIEPSRSSRSSASGSARDGSAIACSRATANGPATARRLRCSRSIACSTRSRVHCSRCVTSTIRRTRRSGAPAASSTSRSSLQ